MEKPPLRGSCFHSVCGNRAQFKEAPSLRGPIVLNGSHPKAALLFPLFHYNRARPDVTSNLANQLQDHPAEVMTPTFNYLLVQFLHHRKSGHFWSLKPFVFWSPSVLELRKQCREQQSFPLLTLCACWNLHVIHTWLCIVLQCKCKNLHCEAWSFSPRILLVHLNPVIILMWTTSHMVSSAQLACFAQMYKCWLACGLSHQHHVRIHVFPGCPVGPAWYWMLSFHVSTSEAWSHSQLYQTASGNTTAFSEVHTSDVVTFLPLFRFLAHVAVLAHMAQPMKCSGMSSLHDI